MIKFISFFYKNQRVVVKADSRGLFRVPVSYVRDASIKTEYRNLRAMQIIKHKIIRDCDPVLTLQSGEKVRVFQGGDPSYLPAMSEGILQKHDDANKSKTSFVKQTTFYDLDDWGAMLGYSD